MELKNSYVNQRLGFYEKPITKPSFKGSFGVETIKHYNIGMTGNGIIGKVRVRKKNGEEAFLNVMKNVTNGGDETYQLQEKYGKVIGEIVIKIKKSFNYDRLEFPEDPSHVFVETLRNYSKKDTPYYRQGLDEYKDIGTRLLQIAQRRSDECCCNGNIQLISKNESKLFYEKLGFVEMPKLYNYAKQNKMYLPPDAKEPLSKLSGGL